MTHAELQAAIERTDLAIDAAEAHGWLCGALCVRYEFVRADARLTFDELAGVRVHAQG